MYRPVKPNLSLFENKMCTLGFSSLYQESRYYLDTNVNWTVYFGFCFSLRSLPNWYNILPQISNNLTLDTLFCHNKSYYILLPLHIIIPWWRLLWTIWPMPSWWSFMMLCSLENPSEWQIRIIFGRNQCQNTKMINICQVSAFYCRCTYSTIYIVHYQQRSIPRDLQNFGNEGRNLAIQ